MTLPWINCKEFCKKIEWLANCQEKNKLTISCEVRRPILIDFFSSSPKSDTVSFYGWKKKKGIWSKQGKFQHNSLFSNFYWKVGEEGEIGYYERSNTPPFSHSRLPGLDQAQGQEERNFKLDKNVKFSLFHWIGLQ